MRFRSPRLEPLDPFELVTWDTLTVAKARGLGLSCFSDQAQTLKVRSLIKLFDGADTVWITMAHAGSHQHKALRKGRW